MKNILKFVVFILVLTSCQDDDSLTINKEWTKISSWGHPDFAKCIAVDGATIYVGTSSVIYRSTDNGDTWTTLPPYSHFGNSGGLTSIHINNNAIFGGIPVEGFIYSKDNGNNWSNINGAIPQTETIQTITSNSEYLFVGTNGSGLFRSNDNGSSWENVIEEGSVLSIASDGNSILVFIYNKGIFHSNDNGDNWTDITGSTEIKLGSKDIYIEDQTILFATNKFYKSSDLGVTWKELSTSSGIEATASVYSIISDENMLYATTGAGVFFSRDIGENWTKLSNKDEFNEQIFRLASNDKYLFGIDQYNVHRISK